MPNQRQLPKFLPNAMTMYVDGDVGERSCADYAPHLRSYGGSSASAYASLDSAAMVAQAGDSVSASGGGFVSTTKVLLLINGCQVYLPRVNTPASVEI